MKQNDDTEANTLIKIAPEIQQKEYTVNDERIHKCYSSLTTYLACLRACLDSEKRMG